MLKNNVLWQKKQVVEGGGAKVFPFRIEGVCWLHGIVVNMG